MVVGSCPPPTDLRCVRFGGFGLGAAARQPGPLPSPRLRLRAFAVVRGHRSPRHEPASRNHGHGRCIAVRRDCRGADFAHNRQPAKEGSEEFFWMSHSECLLGKFCLGPLGSGNALLVGKSWVFFFGRKKLGGYKSSFTRRSAI